jgi:hypothetical protein
MCTDFICPIIVQKPFASAVKSSNDFENRSLHSRRVDEKTGAVDIAPSLPSIAKLQCSVRRKDARFWRKPTNMSVSR